MYRQIRPESFDFDQKCLCEEPHSQHYEEVEHGQSKTIYCSSCNTERREYVFSGEDDSSEVVGIADEAVEEEPPTLNPQLQISVYNEPIDSSQKAESLAGGDHIAWARDKRKLSGLAAANYSHHAIVESNEGTHLDIIHFARDENHSNEIRIRRSRLDINSDKDMKFNNLFCIQYPQRILDENPPELVVKRARDRLDEKKYNLATNNCESFATYCKMGVSRSLQVDTRVMSILKKLPKIFTPLSCAPRVVVWIVQFSSAEVVEALASLAKHLTYVNIVGVTLYIVAEGIVVAADIYQLYKARKDERLTDKEEFKKAIKNRVLLGFGRVCFGTAFSIPTGLAFAAAGGAIGSLVPVPGGTVIGAAVGGVVGSVVGGVAGVGALEGTRTIFWSFWNSQDVTSIDQLKLADHIILPGLRRSHPRCHAIVTCIDKKNKRIMVVRNSRKDGVIEEYVNFEKMKRINYSFASCYSPEVVIRRARRKIGMKRYNIALFNCKTFAKQQKMKEELNF